MQIISKSEARANKLVHFYTDVPCKNGHLSPRFTSNGACILCQNPKTKRKLIQRDEVAVYHPGFTWDRINRAKIVDVFIDTGDIVAAREAIGVSASVYAKELEHNQVFAQAIAEAEILAKKHLKERARQLALRGNDKMLIAELKAEFAEYRDSLKIEQTQTVRFLSNADLDRRIGQLQQRIEGPIDADFSEVRQIGVAQTSPGEGAPAVAEQNSDVLSGDGSP